MSITTSMLCSTSSTVLPCRWSARIWAFICSIIVGFTAAAGSSSSRRSGSGIRAAAKASSFRWP
jgi:hypothetical protein